MHHGKTISFKYDSPRQFKIVLCGLSLAMASVCSAQAESKSATGDSPSGINKSNSSEVSLREQASLDPSKLAAKADTIKSSRKSASKPVEDASLKALREQTQQALAKASSDEERENITAEYLAIQQAVQAQKTLDANSKAKSTPSTK